MQYRDHPGTHYPGSDALTALLHVHAHVHSLSLPLSVYRWVVSTWGYYKQ